LTGLASRPQLLIRPADQSEIAKSAGIVSGRSGEKPLSDRFFNRVGHELNGASGVFIDLNHLLSESATLSAIEEAPRFHREFQQALCSERIQ
jgi:hypothetical protein